MRIVLSASGLVAEDTVVSVSVVVLWLVVVVAVLWHVVVVVPSVRWVSLSLLWAAVVQADRVGPCAFLESGSCAPSLIIIFRNSFSTVMPFDLVLSHTGSLLFFVKTRDCFLQHP